MFRKISMCLLLITACHTALAVTVDEANAIFQAAQESARAGEYDAAYQLYRSVVAKAPNSQAEKAIQVVAQKNLGVLLHTHSEIAKESDEESAEYWFLSTLESHQQNDAGYLSGQASILGLSALMVSDSGTVDALMSLYMFKRSYQIDLEAGNNWRAGQSATAIGEKYQMGLGGIPQSDQQALEWFKRSQALGYTLAAIHIGSLEKKMAPQRAVQKPRDIDLD